MSHGEKTGVVKWVYTTLLEPLNQLLADVPLTAVELPEFPSSCTTVRVKVTRDIWMKTCHLNSKGLHSAPFTTSLPGSRVKGGDFSQESAHHLCQTWPHSRGRCGSYVRILSDTGEASPCHPTEKSIKEHQVHTASNHTENQDTGCLKTALDLE